jgi:hypothetical protein
LPGDGLHVFEASGEACLDAVGSQRQCGVLAAPQQTDGVCVGADYGFVQPPFLDGSLEGAHDAQEGAGRVVTEEKPQMGVDGGEELLSTRSWTWSVGV